ncbi:nucleoside hydrolase-like [Rhopilema esculentum]|uniref:nucleoside hydrolase-like n=1 Tax=Rhopilema esculentum TaxID=499914 RepID=UPI0031D97907|eukprot:gene15283-6494_t
MNSQKVKLIIDTDPGFDDAMAIGVAMRWPNVELLALTCVNGNVPCWQTSLNALKIRQLFERKDVPVFKGAEFPIFTQYKHEASYWHGTDGLLDVTDYIKVDKNELEEKDAVSSIIDIATKHKGEVTLLAIGPLTNLALAVRIRPDLPKLLKEVVILGGNYTGLGNQTRTGEFNFVADPLAARIVLEEYTCPKYVVPWEAVLDHPFSSTFEKIYCGKDNERSRFFKKLGQILCGMHELTSIESADSLAVCVALDKEGVIAEKFDTFATVEFFGEQTHGMMVVERRRTEHRHGVGNESNIRIVTKLNMERVEEMLIHSVS